MSKHFTRQPAFSARRRFIASACAIACAATGIAPAALAQSWPSKPITIIVPFTPGTGMDNLARTLSPRLAQRLGQPVIVDNKPGASGNIGTGIAASAAPDGHTLLVTANTFVTNASLFKNIPYDPVKSFVPVAPASVGALALAVNPSVPARNLQEFINLLKANPGKYSFSSPGNGTPQHLAMELFTINTGTQMLHVPYKGSAGAITDLLGGSVQAMVLPVHSALGHAKTGKLVLLGVAQEKRAAAAPAVPTFAEQGVKGAEVDLWYGVLAPAGTPPAVVSRLNTEINQILSQPDVREALDKQGMTATPGSADKLGNLIRTDAKRWADVIKRANITAD
ncbi:tripartite tricarboxylate transporter substrate binding protein [Lacisediminimonas profundi]|uniref:tripartite tricarboxylate transporter substrate binding protein n=1 Tax=Lacisediminimonas profundi TaxID=2603856 RepID=UPI00124BBA6D|nr:tripartite tricarboxylate transporter substrate binding protein [Lacisediminimonas profundi]